MKRITAVMLLCIIVLCGCTQAIEPNNANTAPLSEETGVPTPPIREIEGIVPFMEYEGYYFYGTLKNENYIDRIDSCTDFFIVQKSSVRRAAVNVEYKKQICYTKI